MDKRIEQAYEEIVLAWRQLPLDSADAFFEALSEYKVYFAYNSGRIENKAITYHDTRDIFDNGHARNFTGDVRTLFEIQNQKECHNLLVNFVFDGRPLDEGLLSEAHGVLTQGTYDEGRWRKGERPGAYKRGDYVVGISEAGLPADEVAPAVRSLIEELGVANESNILTAAAYFHQSLESIHPFADGNGRVGRALMNYLFMLYKHPPVIIYDDDKLAYYAAMRAWDEDGDLDAMKRFLVLETVKTWQGKLN